MKIITMIISLCLLVTLSSSSYALNCNKRNWKNTVEYTNEVYDLFNTGRKKYIDASNSNFSNTAKRNHETLIEEIDSRIETIDDAIDDFKQTRELYDIVEDRWYSLHEDCDGRNSDVAYDNYKKNHKWYRDVLWNGNDKNIVDAAIKVKKSLEKLKRDLINPAIR